MYYYIMYFKEATKLGYSWLLKFKLINRINFKYFHCLIMITKLSQEPVDRGKH